MTKKLATTLVVVLAVLFVASLSKTYLVEDWVEKRNNERLDKINRAFALEERQP